MSEKSSAGYSIKRRPLWLCLIFCAVTLGVYIWIWLYKVLRDSNRISQKKREYLPLYISVIAAMVLADGFLISGLAVMIACGSLVYPITPALFTEMSLNVAITALILSSIGLLFAVAGYVLLLILLYYLSSAVEEKYIYYVIPFILFGLLIPLIFVQSAINDYHGVYEADEQPRYLGTKRIQTL